MSHDDITKINQRSEQAAAPGMLVVLGADAVRTIELPSRGTLSIGRDPTSDIRIDDGTVSRRHATVTVEDGRVTLVDLGSQNGTHVHGARLSGSSPLVVGDVIEIGNACLLVQSLDPARRARAELDKQLLVACDDATRTGGTFALLVLHSSQPVEKLRDALRAVVRPSDLVLDVGPHRAGAICLSADQRGAALIADRLKHVLTTRELNAAIASAVCPREGTRPNELLDAIEESLRGQQGVAPESSAPVARSAGMRAALATAQSVASSNISVLVTGETGTGKQVLAEAIHAASPRASHPFVRINCAAMPEELLEAELFGYERGAFTGAAKDKPGLLEHASGGTFMLDEVGDMPLGLQAKLLQVLEEKRVRRVGGLDLRPIDVRVIAATNRNLEEMVNEGTFRADLFWRLAGMTIEIPALRDRSDDVLPLAKRFLEALSRETGQPAPRLGEDAVEVLLQSAWPGNVRQLRNVMERAFLLARGGAIAGADLARWLSSVKVPGAQPTSRTVAPGLTSPATSVRDELVQIERERILGALRQTNNNQTRAAELLGMPRRTFLEKLDRYGIPRPRKARLES